MADLTPEENADLIDRLMADTNDPVELVNANDPVELTENEYELATGEITTESLLSKAQARRVEALLEAHNLLVTDDPSNGGGLSRALVGELSRERLLTKPSGFTGDLIRLADYILDPTPSTPQPTVVWSGDHDPTSVRMLGNVLGGLIVIPGNPIRDAIVEPIDLDQINTEEG